jgi:hypothetical protein
VEKKLNYAFIKGTSVVGISIDSQGIPDFDMVCGVEDFQSCEVGGSVVDGVFVSKTNIPSHCLTKLSFMNRFNLSELGAIEVSADPIVKVLQRQQTIAEFIDLKDEKTIMGIGYLVSVGILTEARMQEILMVI